MSWTDEYGWQGVPQWIMNLTKYLEDHDISISHALLTHWHGDHTGGLFDLLAYDPDIAVYKNKPDQNQKPIAEGQEFRTQGATLTALLTPGHATDHTCFLLEEENALFTGDNVLGHGFSVAEDLTQYANSLRLMADLGCMVGYPGHGAVIRNLPQVMKRYIAQRDSREQQVYAALVRGPFSQQLGYRESTGSNSTPGSVASGGEEDHEETCEVDGLSVTDISTILYGDLTRHSATFESALKPALEQVLFMLADHGKATSELVGGSGIRYWSPAKEYDSYSW